MIEVAGDSSIVRMDIGGLGIDLQLTAPDLAGMLSQRYRHYPASYDRRFWADVKISSGQPTASLMNVSLQFENGVLRCEAPGCQAFIDPFERIGELRLSTAWPLEEVDYFLRMVCALLAFEAGGLLFHAAGILRRGKAYIFYGHSGSGKTTVTRLSAGDEIINDDLLLIMPSPAGWKVQATPFWNHFLSQPPTAPGVPVGLFRLVQDLQVYLEPASQAHAMAEMAGSVPIVSADLARSPALLQRCQSILDAVPAYRLHFLQDASFWQVIEEALQADN